MMVNPSAVVDPMGTGAVAFSRGPNKAVVDQMDDGSWGVTGVPIGGDEKPGGGPGIGGGGMLRWRFEVGGTEAEAEEVEGCFLDLAGDFGGARLEGSGGGDGPLDEEAGRRLRGMPK